MEEFNPYAAPQAIAEPPALPTKVLDDQTCWRDGDELLVRPNTDLPKYCVKCGQSATDYRKRTFHWHPSWMYLLILINVLVYILVARSVHKPVQQKVGLCAEHKKRRNGFVAMSWLSLVPLLGGFAFDSAAIRTTGIVIFFVMLIWAKFGMQLMVAKRIDPHLAVYRKVSPEFLAKLPRYPHARK